MKARKLFFKECHLAGRQYHDADEVWEELHVGTLLELRRDLDNRYDKDAVAVVFVKGVDKKTGEERTVNSVTLKMTDGLDTFLGEITGEKAVSCPKYDPMRLYRVQCSMVVREWNSSQTGETMQATTIYVDKISMQ